MLPKQTHAEKLAQRFIFSIFFSLLFNSQCYIFVFTPGPDLRHIMTYSRQNNNNWPLPKPRPADSQKHRLRPKSRTLLSRHLF